MIQQQLFQTGSKIHRIWNPSRSRILDLSWILAHLSAPTPTPPPHIQLGICNFTTLVAHVRVLVKVILRQKQGNKNIATLGSTPLKIESKAKQIEYFSETPLQLKTYYKQNAANHLFYICN